MEGGVGSGELLNRGGSVFSRYAEKFQGRQRNGNHLPRSKDSSVAGVNEGGDPLLGIHKPPKILDTLEQERCMEILVGYGIRPRKDCLLHFYWYHLLMVTW